jgi:hypothetical protein
MARKHGWFVVFLKKNVSKHFMRLDEISSSLKKYTVTVKVDGSSIKTTIHAESQSQARQLLVKLYGKDNVQSINESIHHVTTDEMALKQFTPMGDFEKPGPFKGVDKRLIPHPTNQLKAQQFFEKTPYDFRLFFSNISGTGRYSEYGPMKPEIIQQVFGEQAQQIIQGSEDAITVVFVGNKGDSKVMMTPWIMAHRFGHAIQAGHRNVGSSRSGAWPEAEQYFFNTVNQLLERCYGKIAKDQYGRPARSGMSSNLIPEYNALFNSIGTQRSSRSNEIKRPYEFLYELFAQYLGTGTITLNPLPTNLGYGRQVWGNPSKYLNLKPEFRDEEVRQYESQGIGDDLTEYFAEVLRGCIGNIYVM